MTTVVYDPYRTAAEERRRALMIVFTCLFLVFVALSLVIFGYLAWNAWRFVTTNV